MPDYWKIIVKSLEPFPEFNCSGCGERVRHHVLEIYATCPNCNLETKVWIYEVKGHEIQEIIDVVLEWIGTGENFEAVLKGHSIIQKEIEEDKEIENEEE